MNVLTVLCAGGWMPCHLSEGWRRMGATVHEFLYGTHMGKTWTSEGLAANRDVNRDLLEMAHRYKREGRLDLIFAVIYDDVLEIDTARQLRALGVPMVNYHVDLVGQWYRVLRTGRFFDRVACAQRDHWSGLTRAGIRACYMPMAANLPYDDPPPQTDPFEGVTYLGSPWDFRRETLSAIDAAGIPLRVFGHGWTADIKHQRDDPSKAQPLRKNLHDVVHYLAPRLREEGWHGLTESIRGRLHRADAAELDDRPKSYIKGAYREQEFDALVAGSAINLGFTHFRGRSGSRAERRQLRLRDFEIPITGGFYLAQDCAQLRELFEVPRHVAAWDRLPDLLEKIRYYLDRPDERRGIAEAGKAHCLAHHTWQKRFADLLAELGISPP